MAADSARILKEQPIFQQCRRIACYHAFGSEFETMPIIKEIWKAEKVCYLPVLTETKTLHFMQYDEGDELQPNQHSILEPVNNRHTIHPEKLDLVIVPLIAFDPKGYRVGTGGGYYDRTFAFMYTRPEKVPYMLGLGFSVQASEAVDAEAWDIKLDAILTEKGLSEF